MPQTRNYVTTIKMLIPNVSPKSTSHSTHLFTGKFLLPCTWNFFLVYLLSFHWSTKIPKISCYLKYHHYIFLFFFLGKNIIIILSFFVFILFFSEIGLEFFYLVTTSISRVVVYLVSRVIKSI